MHPTKQRNERRVKLIQAEDAARKALIAANEAAIVAQEFDTKLADDNAKRKAARTAKKKKPTVKRKVAK